MHINLFEELKQNTLTKVALDIKCARTPQFDLIFLTILKSSEDKIRQAPNSTVVYFNQHLGAAHSKG